MLAGSRTAAIVALCVAAIQAGLNALGLLGQVMQFIGGTNQAANPVEATGHAVGTLGVTVFSAAMLIALIQLIILLVRLLHERDGSSAVPHASA